MHTPLCLHVQNNTKGTTVTYCSLLIKKRSDIFACGFFSDAVNILTVSYRMWKNECKSNDSEISVEIHESLAEILLQFNLSGQTAMFALLEFSIRHLLVLMDFHISVVQTEPQLSPSQQTDDTYSLHNIAHISRQFAPSKYQIALLHSEYCTRRHVAGLSQRRPEFNPKAPLERFFLCNVALAQVSPRTFDFIFHQISIFKLI